MFEAKLDDVSLLRDSIATISDLIDEAELGLSHNGILLVAPDRAVVVVVDFMIYRNVFSDYQCDNEQKVGINLQSLFNVLRRAATDDSLIIKIEGNKMHLTLSGSSTRRFALPLIDISKEDTPSLDKLDFSANLKIRSDILGSGIEDAELVADSIVLTVRKDQLLMKAESDSSAAQLELGQGEHMKVLDIGTPVRARYSVDYLKKIFKAKKLADSVTLSMSTDYPMRALFEIPGKIRMGFVLAPRVED